MTDPRRSTATRPGAVPMRAAPAGLPDPNLQPPSVAESGNPFSLVRIIDLVARLQRGVPIRIDDIASALDRSYLDWTFAPSVVADALIGLQANWLTDYRNSSGIVLADGPYGATVTIEDSSRVDPWVDRQGERAAAACRAELAAFSRRGGSGFDD